MANLKYTSDLIADVLFRAGEATDGSSDFADQVLINLNKAYAMIYQGGSELDPSVHEDWVWLRPTRPGVLILSPPITTGTVTATQGSASITFSSAPSSSVAGYLFRVSGDSDIFVISAHTAASTSATLDATYTGTGGSGLSYTLMKTDYDLSSSVLRLTAPMRSFQGNGYGGEMYKVHGTDQDAMEREFPLALIQSGTPTRFCYVGESTQGTKRVRFNAYGGPSSTNYIRIEYDYLTLPADLTSPGTSEEPLVPVKWRNVIADIALAFTFGNKNDDRSNGTFELAVRGLQGMAREYRHQHQTDTTRAFRLFPRQEGQRPLGPLRTESGAIIG